MQSGQRGAAHVNIFFFLIMLVLFLGALAFAYVTLQNNTKLLEDIKSADAKAADARKETFLYEHYVEDLRAEIGETGEYAGKEGFDYTEYGNPDPLQNVVVPSRVRTTMSEFAKSIGVPESRGLSTLFGFVKGEFDKFGQQAATMASQKAIVDNEVAQLKSQISELTATQRREVDRLNSALSQARADYDADRAESVNTIQSANQEYTRVREEKSDQAAEHAVVVGGLRKEIETLGARIDAAADKVKLLNPSPSPDGMVIDSSQATGLAWINIGRRDMLPIGTTFEIVKPGSYEQKAFATVRRLEQTRAEVRVTGLRDRYDPVMPGDMVRNDLYSPDMRHNIYLMGRFAQPYTRPLVKTLLENLGNQVVDELGPGVDLVLLGGNAVNDEGSGFTPINETEEFKLAQFLRIEMAPLTKVRQYLKLTDDMISAR